jgi:uncharacterized membrane protein YozB (DUF420 family)
VTGIFPSSAPVFADVVAVAEVLMACMLVFGAVLAYRGRIRAHRYLQSAIVLVNIPIVLSWMVPAYLQYVLPSIPAKLGAAYVLVPTFMLFAGGVAEGLGVYIILVAGTTWIPERFRFRRYKLWMRTELALWWAVVIAGLTTYWLFFGPSASI